MNCFNLNKTRTPSSLKPNNHHMLFYRRVNDRFKNLKTIWITNHIRKIQKLKRLIPPLVSTPFLLHRRERGTRYDSTKVDREVKSEVKWKVKSEVKSIFGPLNFFVFRYVEGGVLGNNYISIKKCRTTFLWVLNFGEVGEILENFQKHPLGESFWKMVSKVIFWKNYKGISL